MILRREHALLGPEKYGAGRLRGCNKSSGIRTSGHSEQGRPGQVVAFGDVDNDGDLDVATGYHAGDSSVETSEVCSMMVQTFFDPADNFVRDTLVDQPTGASFVDVDHDGVDLWLTQGSAEQDRLSRTGRWRIYRQTADFH